MRSARAFFIALGIAIPLWLRQWQVERAVNAHVRRRDLEFTNAWEQGVRDLERWREDLTKEIRRAMRERP